MTAATDSEWVPYTDEVMVVDKQCVMFVWRCRAEEEEGVLKKPDPGPVWQGRFDRAFHQKSW